MMQAFLFTINSCPKTTSIKHVGIKLHANFDHWERIAETGKSIKLTSMALLQSGCHPHGLSAVTSLKLVKTLCLAKSLYGCELWNTLSRNELLALERAFISRFNPLLKEQAHHVINICTSWRPMSCEGVCSLCHSKYADLLIHVICNCRYVTRTRDEFYMSLLDTGPIELSVALRAIPDSVLVSNLLSCQPPVNVVNTIEVIYGETVVYYIHLLSKIYFEAISTRN